MSKIELITHPFALDLLRSRIDYSIVTDSELVERPYWFKNKETGQEYYDLYACLGWPSEVTDSSDGLPGYAAIVGVVRPAGESIETSDPTDANFQLLAEAESKDVPVLLRKCVELREEWGFGVQKNLLTFFFGDAERFAIPLALMNEDLIEESGDTNAILVTPFDEMYAQKIFDSYVRALRSTLLEESRRFFFGFNDILRNRLREFNRDDPAVFAAGGLIFSLLNRVRWMDSRQETAFTVDNENEL